jgi:aspartate dehydrogenase
MKTRVGVVGCGAIGSSLAMLVARKMPGMQVSRVFDLEASKSVTLSRRLCGSARLAAGSLEAVVSASDIVVEAASARCSAAIARSALQAGKSVLVMSVGGILAAAPGLQKLALRTGGRLLVPSGAVAGIDALKAMRWVKVSKVVLTTRKPAKAFANVRLPSGKTVDAASIGKDTVLFEGSARDAVRYFPQNINVAAVIALAGIGAGRTRVRIVASPGLKRNVHEVQVTSAAGVLTAVTENAVHPDNPKTSFLAVLSAAAALQGHTAPMRAGS